MRILYLQPSFTPPPKDLRMDRFNLMPENLEGDVLQPVWMSKPSELVEKLGKESYPVYTVGRFRYQWFLAWPYRGIRTQLAVIRFFLSRGLEMHRKNRYDCIVTYSHMTPALIGVVLKLFTGAKLVVEVVCAPHLSYFYNQPERTWKDKIGKLYSDACLHLSLWMCDRVHLLYKEQLDHYPLLKRVPASVFAEFIPVSMIPRQAESDPMVLFVGAPWYLKGVDVLIEAFRGLEAEFPNVKLAIQGYFPDLERVKALAKGSPQIEFLKATGYLETLDRISRSKVFVLPSRCEGTARVLLEAMSAGVASIGSDVGGTPALIRSGESGFLVPVGSAGELEARLRELLSDEELRKKMGAEAYRTAHEKFNEQIYVDQFTKMIAAVSGPR